MRGILRSSLIFVALPFLLLTKSYALGRFESLIETDVPLKHALPLYVQHQLGKVSIQGWVQDRIRVTLKYSVFAESQTLAEIEFKKLELVTLETRDRFELRVGHAQKSDLVSKMRDLAKNSVQVDIEIKAPIQSDLTLILGEGKALSLENWQGGFTLLGQKSLLEFKHLAMNRDLTVNCVECETTIKDSKASGHLSVGSKSVLLKDSESKACMSMDGGSEEFRVENFKGCLNVHLKSGRLSVSRMQGDLSLQSGEGGADVSGFSGNVNLQTQSGQVILDVDDPAHALNVDSDRGDVQISLPPSFEGALDLMSLKGEVVVQFPYELKHSLTRSVYGPISPGRIEGDVGSKTNVVLHAFSKQGGVRILRKVPSK